MEYKEYKEYKVYNHELLLEKVKSNNTINNEVVSFFNNGCLYFNNGYYYMYLLYSIQFE